MSVYLFVTAFFTRNCENFKLAKVIKAIDPHTYILLPINKHFKEKISGLINLIEIVIYKVKLGEMVRSERLHTKKVGRK